MPSKPASQPAPRRVAFMLELQWPYKRHTGIFAGAQRYAQEQGWESTIDDYVAEQLPAKRTKSLPYDGVIGRASKKLAERAERLGLAGGQHLGELRPCGSSCQVSFPTSPPGGACEPSICWHGDCADSPVWAQEVMHHKVEVAAFRSHRARGGDSRA